jgi:hypothetical protein
MHRAYLLIVTAIGEAGTGLVSLARPSVPLALILGVERAAPEATFITRLFGAALLAIGLSCWLGCGDGFGPSQIGLIAGALVYDATVAALLAYVGSSSNLVGIALWPVVGLHAALAAWCAVCLRGWRNGSPARGAGP